MQSNITNIRAKQTKSVRKNTTHVEKLDLGNFGKTRYCKIEPVARIHMQQLEMN